MERIAMNQEERDWLEWLKRVQDGVFTQQHAAAKMGVSGRWVRKLVARMKTDGDAVVMGVSGRWVRKLVARMKTDGDAVVVHGLRGRSSNRRIDERSEEHTSELQSLRHLVCRLLLEKKQTHQ